MYSPIVQTYEQILVVEMAYVRLKLPPGGAASNCATARTARKGDKHGDKTEESQTTSDYRTNTSRYLLDL